MKKFAIVCGVLALAGVVYAIVPGAAVLAQGAPDPNAPEPRPIIDTYEVMEFMMDPAYVQLKDNVQAEPAGRREWRALYVATYTIAEQANLLFSRNDEEYMLTEDWDKMTVDMREKAVALGEHIKAQDYAKVKAGYVALIESCNACHTATTEDAPKVEFGWE